MKIDDWFMLIAGITGIFSVMFLAPRFVPWVERNSHSLSDCRGIQSMTNSMILAMLIAEVPMLIIATFLAFDLMSMLAAVVCAGIVLFCIVCLVAWFAYRNRPIKLGGK